VVHRHAGLGEDDDIVVGQRPSVHEGAAGGQHAGVGQPFGGRPTQRRVVGAHGRVGDVGVHVGGYVPRRCQLGDPGEQLIGAAHGLDPGHHRPDPALPSPVVAVDSAARVVQQAVCVCLAYKLAVLVVPEVGHARSNRGANAQLGCRRDHTVNTRTTGIHHSGDPGAQQRRESRAH
jgi:hypothetical protein